MPFFFAHIRFHLNNGLRKISLSHSFLLCITFEKDITSSSSSSNVNVERCLSMIPLVMNQWSKKRLCMTLLCTYSIDVFLWRLPSISNFFPSPFLKVTLRTSPSMIWVIFYHFAWVNFHQLIKKDFLYLILF